MDDDLFVIPSDNILLGETDGVFVGGDQDLLSESESIVGPPGPQGPAGKDGKDGVDGQSATVTVGSTVTTGPSTDAVVTNVGTNLNAILNFSIPRGAVGETGPAGADGVDGVDGSDGFSPIASVEQTEYGAEITITDQNGTTTAQVVNGSQGEPGTPGTPGEAATITVGSTTTGAAGTSASVTNSGTSSAAVLDFVIPQGANGQNGYTPVITATAAVNSTTGTPYVNVYKTGTDEYPLFDFAFGNLKGETGETPSAQNIALTDYITLNSGYSLADSNVYTFGKLCIVYLKVSSTNNFTSSQSTIGKINSGYRPKSLINGFGSLGGGQWSISGDTCYVYIATNGDVIVADHQNTGKKWLSIMLTYIIN